MVAAVLAYPLQTVFSYVARCVRAGRLLCERWLRAPVEPGGRPRSASAAALNPPSAGAAESGNDGPGLAGQQTGSSGGGTAIAEPG